MAHPVLKPAMTTSAAPGPPPSGGLILASALPAGEARKSRSVPRCLAMVAGHCERSGISGMLWAKKIL